MLKQVTKNKEIDDILRGKFKGYQVSDDPFERVATYTKKGIIGIVSYSIIYERGEINYIVVSEDKFRNGIGSKLLEYAIKDMSDNGVTTVSLEVEENNEPAINLYLKHGFKKEAIRPSYYDGSDGYLMTRKLEVRK